MYTNKSNIKHLSELHGLHEKPGTKAFANKAYAFHEPTIVLPPEFKLWLFNIRRLELTRPYESDEKANSALVELKGLHSKVLKDIHSIQSTMRQTQNLTFSYMNPLVRRRMCHFQRYSEFFHFQHVQPIQGHHCLNQITLQIDVASGKSASSRS